MAHHMSIGRFAGLTGISINTLRRYDESGLLSPAFVDPFTGYRLYAVEQLDIGILIRLLRDLDVPLHEVKALLSAHGAGDVKTVLAHHRERVSERHAELERILARIDVAMNQERGLLPYEVETVALHPVWVVSRRTTTLRPRLDITMARCLEELEGELQRAGAHATGRELVLYHNWLQWYLGLDFEVCLPVDRAVAEALGGARAAGRRRHADRLSRALGRYLAGVLGDARADRAQGLRGLRSGARVLCGRRARHRRPATLRDGDDVARASPAVPWVAAPRASAGRLRRAALW